VPGRASSINMVGMAVMGHQLVCLYYLRFAPAHPGCPAKSPESCKMCVCVCVGLRKNVEHLLKLVEITQNSNENTNQ